MGSSLLLLASLCPFLSQSEEAGGLVLELKQDLARLAVLRKGRDTPLRRVDELGQELLKKYPGPKEQGAIYYQLAHIHAQSGVREPDRIIEYARKALDFPLEPSQRMRLYVYRGDAIQVKQARSPVATWRKEAALPYLQGLKGTLRYRLPEIPPELPIVAAYDVDGPPAEVEKFRQEHERAVASYQEAEFQRDMIRHRNVLTQQLVGLYSRKPYATEELEQLARQTLDAPVAVERLMKSLPAAIEKDRQIHAAIDAKNAAAQNESLPVPAPVSWAAYLWLVVTGTLVALAIFALFYWRRQRTT
jgi:hypothetical protein